MFREAIGEGRALVAERPERPLAAPGEVTPAVAALGFGDVDAPRKVADLAFQLVDACQAALFGRLDLRQCRRGRSNDQLDERRLALAMLTIALILDRAQFPRLSRDIPGCGCVAADVIASAIAAYDGPESGEVLRLTIGHDGAGLLALR